MQEDKDLRLALDNALDKLCELSKEEIRQRFYWNRIPQNVDFTCSLGGTEYTVASHFKEHADEGLADKIIRLLDEDIAI